MRKIHILLVFMLLVLPLRADFYDVSLNVTVKINLNGSAHVTEITAISMDPSSVDLYNKSFYSTQLTIQDWQRITRSQYLRQHILSETPASNLRVAPEDIRSYTYTGLAEANIRLDYDVNNIVTINQTGPRTLMYTLNSSSLSFQPSPSGEVLPRSNSLTIIIPPGSLVTDLAPDPTSPQVTRDYLNEVIGVSNFTWSGTVPLIGFSLVYTMEEPMDVEVLDFFQGIETRAVNILLSAPGLVLTLIVILAVAYLVLSKR